MEIKRDIEAKLYEDLFGKHVIILVGARQVGKTFLLKKIEAEARSRGQTTAFFDLEQPEALALFNKDKKEIINLLLNAGQVVFIDEFHYIKNASQIFKAVYDQDRPVKIFASGSSSTEIHKHLKESLAGRKIVYRVPPCSLREIGQIIKDDVFDYYCRFGGMPGLIHARDIQKRELLLADIVQSYILKDIKALIREENITAFNNLLYLLAQYQGSTISLASLSREIGLTAKSIEAHLEIMAQTFVCFPVYSYSRNFANELKKSKKFYLYDLGIRNSLLKNFSGIKERPDAGAIVESFVFNELHRQLDPETEIRFWRLKDGTEVDFVWIRNQKPYPIEVKSRLNGKEIPEGIKAFINRYPDTKLAFVLNQNIEGEINFKDTRVVFERWEKTDCVPSTISSFEG